MAVEWTKILTEADMIDENDMASDSATKVPTQQSVKKYVDDNSGGGSIDNVARDNIVILAWKLAIAEGLTTFNLEDGVVDAFEDESGVDTDASQNQEYNSTDDYYSPSAGSLVDNMEYSTDSAARFAYVSNGSENVFSVTLSSAGSGFQNSCIRSAIPASSIPNKSYKMFRLRFMAPTSENTLYINAAYFGELSGTYSFQTSPTKVQVTFSGSTSATISAGSTLWSDWLAFPSDGTKDLLVAIDIGNSYYITQVSSGAGGSGYKAGADASTDSASGYSWGAGTGRLVDQVEGTVLQVYSESTIKTQGSYSLKGIATTDAVDKTLTHTIGSPIDLSGVGSVFFDMYALRTGSNIKVGIHDSGGTTTEITPNITDSNTWQEVEIDLSGVADANKDAIDSVIITIVNADSANTFYIDNFSGLLANMTLISEPIEAEAEPTNARLLILAEPIDAITINTDFKGYVSLDGGSNFEQITLVDEGDFDTAKHIYAGSEGLTDHDDKTMVWKITTLNNKDAKIHAVGLLWK